MVYSYEDKLLLKSKIEQLDEYNKYLRIFKIIMKYNHGLNFSNNNNGIFLYFHKLDQRTYKEIDILLKKYKSQDIYNIDMFKHVDNSNTPYIFIEDKYKGTGLKYTVLEKNIIRQRLKDELLNN